MPKRSSSQIAHAPAPKKRVVILGAGLAGLSAGWVLARQGCDVELIEKNSYAGGLAITRSSPDGFRWDLGPHNIHTVHGHIIIFLKRAFSGLHEHTLTSQIFKNGKYISYPLQGIKVLTSLPPARLVQAGLSFVTARVRMFLGEPKDDNSFEAWIRNRFGSVLLREYFFDYPAKVWGVIPSQIDRYVAEKRVPVISLVELVRTTLFGKRSRLDHPEFTTAHYYLPDGIGEIPDYLAAGLRDAGGRITLNTEAERVITRGDRVTGVIVKSGSERRSIECDYLLSTIPVNDFVCAFDTCTEPIQTPARGLDYVSSVLLFLKVSRRNVIPAKLLYFDRPEILFSRVSDMAMFSPSMAPDGKALLCFEFPCSHGDSVWNMSVESLTRHAVGIFEEKGLMKADEVEGSFLEHISHSYPRFRVGFQGRLNECFRFLSQFTNVLSYGRQGGFSYINTDSVTHLGFHAADAVIMSESMGYSCSEWFLAHAKRGS